MATERFAYNIYAGDELGRIAGLSVPPPTRATVGLAASTARAPTMVAPLPRSKQIKQFKRKN